MSEQNHPHTLHWLERPLPELTRLAWPIAVSMISYSLMSVADTLFVSWLGPAELAGVSLGGTLSFALLCFPFGILVSTKTLVSQSLGAGRPQDAPAFIGPALWLAWSMGAVVTLVAYFAAEVVPQLTASHGAGAAVGSYLAVRGLGAPLALVSVALREGRQGLGDARSPMVAALAGNAANIGLDYVLLFVADLGPAGAAWASNVAQLIEASLLLVAQRRDGLILWGPLRAHLRAIVKLGLPTGLQFLLEIGSFSLLALMISAISDVQMAAHQIVLQVLHLSFLPAHAIAEANAVLVGQLVGAQRQGRVAPLCHRALAMAAAYMGLCGVGLFFGGSAIVALFTQEPRVGDVAITLFQVAAWFQVIDAANMVGRSALRGAGDVRFPAVLSVGVAWLCTPTMMWLLGYRMGLGALGGWLGITAELTLVAVILWWRLERGGWRRAAELARQSREVASAAEQPLPVEDVPNPALYMSRDDAA